MTTLPRSARKLRDFVKAQASARSVAKAGNDKLLIDQNLKAAQAAAQQALDDAIAAGDQAAIAAASAALGELAYNGTLRQSGILAASYQDHGVGRNKLPFSQSMLTAYPQGQWYYNGAALTDVYLTDIGAFPTQNGHVDALYQYATDDGVWSPWQAFFLPLQMSVLNNPHIYSAYCYYDYGGRGQVRIKQASTMAGARDDTGTTVLASGDISYDPTYRSTGRPAVTFTPTQTWLRVEFRTQRTGGGSGYFETAYWYNFMLEEVVAGQSAPSKFMPPVPGRGETPANAIEGDALKGYIQGLGVTKGSGSLGFNVEAGSCYIPGVARVVPFPGGSDVVGSAAGVRYIYLQANAYGSSATITTSTSPPASPYISTARTRSGDTKQRFIGIVVVYGGIIPRFQEADGYYTFQDDTANRVITTTTPLSASTLSLVPWMPTFSRQADILVHQVFDTGASTLSVGPAGTAVGSGVSVIQTIVTSSSVRSRIRGMVQTDGNNAIAHAVSAQPAQASVIMAGFWYDR